MGALTEAARRRDNYIRTLNPIYSFAIFGKNKQYFQSIKLETALGVDSVFSRLMELAGRAYRSIYIRAFKSI
jgi:aminoglycoside 3-N-acetyltransferase